MNENYLTRVAEQIRTQVPAELLPDDEAPELFLAYAVLARVKGAGVTASDVHDAWCAWMATRKPDHESLVPFSELPEDVQREDSPFVSAIRAVARSST